MKCIICSASKILNKALRPERADEHKKNIMTIRLIITGGTIDCQRKEGTHYFFGETHLPQMLQQARVTVKTTLQVLFLKDSLHTTDEDRHAILQACIASPEDKIVITHGTDTMHLTAKVLGEKIKDKTIVLLGAMIPYNQPNSDALFNLGCAMASVQILGTGVYVTMHGRIFSWHNVRKNRESGLFEPIQ